MMDESLGDLERIQSNFHLGSNNEFLKRNLDDFHCLSLSFPVVIGDFLKSDQ